MLDIRGNNRVIRQQGRLGLDKQGNILSALERGGHYVSATGDNIAKIMTKYCTTKPWMRLEQLKW